MERALCNLQILGEEDAVKNRVVAHSLESKLPSSLKREWILHKTDPANRFSQLNHFDCLLIFLKKQEKILEELDQLEPSPADNGPLEKGAADYPYKGGGRLSLSPQQVRRTTIPAALSVEMTLMPASYLRVKSLESKIFQVKGPI